MSAHHLSWATQNSRAETVEASLAVRTMHSSGTGNIVFWALQVSFVDVDGVEVAGAHIGLQDRYSSGSLSDRRLVNWGGYEANGGPELDGSTSALPELPALPSENTRMYYWEVDKAYKLRVYRSPKQVWAASETSSGIAMPAGYTAWRATVTDMTTGVTTIVRDLFIPDNAAVNGLAAPTVWTECVNTASIPAGNVCDWFNLRWDGLDCVQGVRVTYGDSNLDYADNYNYTNPSPTSTIPLNLLRQDTYAHYPVAVDNRVGYEGAIFPNVDVRATFTVPAFKYLQGSTSILSKDGSGEGVDFLTTGGIQCYGQSGLFGSSGSWEFGSDTPDFWTECWLRTTGNTNERYIVRYGYYGFYLKTSATAGGIIRAGHWNNAGTEYTINATDRIDDDEWHYVVYSVASNTAKLYIDKVEQSSTALADNTVQLFSGGSGMGLGKQGPFDGPSYHGIIDQFAIHKTELTTPIMDAHYAAYPRYDVSAALFVPPSSTGAVGVGYPGFIPFN